MIEEVRQDILTILLDAFNCIKTQGPRVSLELKELSNRTIHDASIYQDNDSISVAVLIYALSKILARSKTLEGSAVKWLEEAFKALEAGKVEQYRARVKKLFDWVKSQDSQFSRYITEVVTQAKLKKGGKLFDHGVSIAQAGEILNVSQWDLVGYMGHTKYEEETIGNVRERLAFARQLFK